MIGANIITSHLNDVIIKNSRCRYLNLADVKTKQLTINDSDLSEASLFNITFQKFNTDNTNYQKAEITETSLHKINFSKCNISDIRVDQKSLRGIEVNTLQAMDLLKLFDINIIE
jgi:uncharacterized protein YjbI with pentapeptide repeats